MSKKIKESRELKFVKSGENKNLVTLATVYDTNCSQQKVIEIDDRVLSEMIKSKKEDNNYERWQRDRIDCAEFNEVTIGEVYGIREESFEDAVLENIWLEELLRECGEKSFNRAKLAITKGLSARAIAEMEGVSHSAVSKSLTKVKKILCKMTGLIIDF